MSEERVERWAVVEPGGNTFVDKTKEGAQGFLEDRDRLVHLVEKRDTESIVDTAELSALREKAEGPIVEAPRPFKVGDRVGTTYADKGTVILAVKWDEDGEVCEPKWHKLKLLAPAPAPEATAAPGEPLRVQMVPVSLLDEVVKNRDEWKARAENAEAQCRSVERWHQSLVIDERARFERECAMRLLAALVTRGAPHIGQKETEPLLSLAKQMADHYLPAKEQGK